MNIIDIIVLTILVTFAIIGFQRGVFKSLVAFVGFVVIVCLAYLLKNYLGDIFVLNLPFIKFSISSNPSVVMNIVMYQTIAFIIILIILGIAYRVLLKITGIFEKILRITIILGIPSKLLGLVVGILEGYIIAYLLLFFVAQPYVKMDILDNSSMSKTILNKTPILSNFSEKTLNIINEVNDIVKEKTSDDFDLKLTDLLLKQKVVTADVMQELVDNKKIEVDGIQRVIDKYKSGVEKND